MVVVHGTRRFRDRVPGLAAAQGDVSTTALGAWYASLLRCRRPVALLVNEATLLLLMPLAPARTLLERLPGALAELLAAHQLPAPFVAAEQAETADTRLGPTANRSVVGVLNEFRLPGRGPSRRRGGPARAVAGAGGDTARAALPPARQPEPRAGRARRRAFASGPLS